jgi:Holliday junction DNA helicase RuvA
MIAYLRGRLVQKEPAFVIVDVNGIGYQVLISLTTYSEIKDREDLTLQTVLIVREDAHILYGFSSGSEKSMFQQLISVNGIGPGTAMMVLSSMNPVDLKKAILKEEVHTLQSVKGIGSKTAQRLILELKDKIRREGEDAGETGAAAAPHNTIRNEALSALMTLGISRPAAEKSIDAILKKSGNTLSLEDLVKIALKNA